MARTPEKDRTPQVALPVGSREEVLACGVPHLRNIATCSEPDPGKNRGCPKFFNCDRKYRGTRPKNEIIRLTKANGGMRVVAVACYEAVHMELDSETNGNLVEVIGEEGDRMKYRGSVKLHPKRDPNCNDCSQGKCERYRDDEKLSHEVTPFPPASEHPEIIKFSRKAQARTARAEQAVQRKKDDLLGPQE